MSNESQFREYQHKPHKTQCGGCSNVYCSFCVPTCPECDSWLIKTESGVWKRSYAQRGEDYLILKFFEKEEPGFFLEIGALDGVRFSNCLALEKSNWKGLCIEAHPYYYSFLERNRKVTTICAAAGDTNNDKGTLLANYAGTLSTINPEIEDQARKRYKGLFGGYEKITIPIRKVDSLLETNKIQNVDCVSIDVEGGELLVLGGFNVEKYAPSLFIIEAFDRQLENNITAYMKKLGYHMARKMANNLFLTNNAGKQQLLEKIEVVPKKTYWHTPTKHPLHPTCGS